MTQLMTDREQLRALLDERLSAEGHRWLGTALERIGAEPAAIRTLFPAAGRQCGREPITPEWTADDAVRAVLLTALPLPATELADEVAALYRYGDAAEKRGVLRGLPLLDTATGIGADGLPLVRDALRTNDTRLVAAALGPYGAAHLDAAAYRHGVLKCVFSGIALSGIHGLPERADPKLARMLADYAHERVAAGRDVPTDVWPVINAHPRELDASGLREELDSAVPERRTAAERAFADRARANAVSAPDAHVFASHDANTRAQHADTALDREEL